MDREKVIRGFTVCSKHGLLNGEDCHGYYEYTDNLADIIKANDYSKTCPYNGCETGCIKTLAKDALSLLKEQETKWIHRADMDYKDKNGVVHFHGMCESCGFIHDFIDGHTGQYKFCPECGRSVKWDV